MNHNSVTNYLLLINNHISAQEILVGYHLKAQALLKVLLGVKLASYSLSTLYHYLWSLDDVITEAKDLNQLLLNRLIKETFPLKKDYKE